MAISFIGHAGAATSTVALPAGAAADDLAIVLALRHSTSPPTVATGYTSLGTQSSGASAGGAVCIMVAYRVLEASDITAGNVGTWGFTNAIRVSVYRGAGTPAGYASSGADSVDLTLPAQTGLDSSSWQVAAGGQKLSPDLNAEVISDYTVRSSDGGPVWLGMWDSGGGTTGIAQKVVTVAASAAGSAGATIYLPAAAADPPTISSVTITGTSQIGQTLTATVVTDQDPVDSTTYQWQKAAADDAEPGTDISGETSSTLALSYSDFADLLDADADSVYVRCQAIATKNSLSSDEDASDWQLVSVPSGVSAGGGSLFESSLIR